MNFKYSSGEVPALKTFSFAEPTVDYRASDSGTWAQQLQERNNMRKIKGDKVPDFAREALDENDDKLIVQIGDLSYTTDWLIVKAFREHLEARKSVYVGFYYVSDIASRLERLKAKKKAEAFEEDIKTFADAHGISPLMFSQWSAVMDYQGKA